MNRTRVIDGRRIVYVRTIPMSRPGKKRVVVVMVEHVARTLTTMRRLRVRRLLVGRRTDEIAADSHLMPPTSITSFRQPCSSLLHPNQEALPLLKDPPPFLEPLSRPSRDSLSGIRLTCNNTTTPPSLLSIPSLMQVVYEGGMAAGLDIESKVRRI